MRSAFLHAWRSWKSAKAIALLAIVAFAVGIGSTTAIYTVVNTVMLGPLPYPNGDRLVALYGARFSEPGQRSSHSFPDLLEYERLTTSFEMFGSYRLSHFTVTAPGEPQHVSGAAVTPSLAHNLGVNPAIGRWFTDETGAVISNTLWRRLGADPRLVGEGITLDGRRLTITGVMPPRFQLPVSGPGAEGFHSDVWIHLDPVGKAGHAADGVYFAYARRKPGVTLGQAEADVKRAAAEIAKREPVSHPSYTARLDDLREASVSEIRPTLLLLFAAAGLLLLITCTNVAALLVARSVARARETATRVALGASRGQLALQYFVEGLYVSLAGAAAGVALSAGLVRLVVGIAPEFIPRADEIAVDWTVLVFAAGTAILTSVLCGLAPLWQAVRTAPTEVLNAGVRASAGARVRTLSHSLVIGEIALAFTLLAVSAVSIAHLRALVRTSPGFDPDGLLTFQITIADAIASRAETRAPFQRRLVEAVKAIPGVTNAALTSELPLDGCCMSLTVYPEGRTINPDVVERTSFVIVNPDYFRTFRIPLKGGRLLTEADTNKDFLYVVINQAAATRYWPGENPIDAHGRLNGPDGAPFRVVGVVGDVRNNGLGRPTVPEIYLLNSAAEANPMALVVRSPLPADGLISEVRRAVNRVDPTLPVHDVTMMNAIVRESMTLERLASFMTTFFALAALLMATLGVYGVVAYAVRQRTVEFGTRMALGAVSRDLLALVIGGGLKMAAVGVAVGSVAAMGALWLLLRFFEIHGIGWMPFASSAAIVAAVAVAACSFPALRATRLSPMVAIREESQFLWQSARTSIRHAVKQLSHAVARDEEAPPVSETMLLTAFVGAARQAESPAEALRIALTTIGSLFGAEAALLLEKAPDGEYRCTAATPEQDCRNCTLPAQGFLLNRLRAHSLPLPVSSGDFETVMRWAGDHRPEYLSEIQALQAAAVRMAVSLRTKTEILGVLLLGPPTGRAEYDAVEKRVLRACADQFALMIENARLTARVVEQEKLRRDLALATEVQKRLLPERPPDARIAALAAVSLPARSVGGDYYDFIDVGNDRIGIALADVAGKGVAAALIMSVVQASLRILSSEGDISLPQLAAKMNRFLHRSTASNSYATFFYAQIDERSRQLRYVNAGHLPPYLLRSSDVQELSAGGAVIGLFPEMSYEEATVDLQPGDVLVAFTDGVTEALNAREEEFGEERLKALLGQLVHLPVQAIAARISEELKRWIKDTAQYDDLTFVVMKVN